MIDASKTIIITGSGGFIGSCLVEHLLKDGYTVRALQKQLPARPRQGLSYYPYVLENKIDGEILENADWLIHCALNKKSIADNLKGSLNLFEACKQKGVKIMFLSTLSAHSDTKSNYGKFKLALENALDEKDNIILKLGLVIGRNGLFGRMKKFIQRMRIIPLFDGGVQPLQTIAIDDLLKIIQIILRDNLSGTYHIAEPEKTSFNDFYRELAKSLQLKCLFLNLPLHPILKIVQIMEKLPVSLPISSENFLGLKHMRAFNTADDLKRLGVRVKTFKQSLEKLSKEEAR